MKNLIYMVADGLTTVSGQPLSLGSIVRRYGNGIGSIANSIVIEKPGYYELDVSAVVENGTAGALTLGLDATQNGSLIMGATASASLAADAIETLPIQAMVRVYCNSTTSIQIVPDTAGITIDTLSVRVTEV